MLRHLTEMMTISCHASNPGDPVTHRLKAYKAKANFENRILTITRPIDEEVKPKSITIIAKQLVPYADKPIS